MVARSADSSRPHRSMLVSAVLQAMLAAAALIPAPSQAQTAPLEFSSLPCGEYAVSVMARIDETFRFCPRVFNWIEASGPVPWQCPEFAAPVSGSGVLTVDGAPAVAVLLEDGYLHCYRCDGALAATYEVGFALRPQPVSKLAGTLSAGSPQLRLFGAGREDGQLVVFGVDVDLADLTADPPVAAQRIRWKRRFDGIDLPLDQQIPLDVWIAGGDFLVQTTVRDPDGDCLLQSPYHSYVTYKLDGETGALLQPVWLGALEVDPDIPAGTAVRALALDGTVAWRVDIGTRVLAVGQRPYTRSGWLGGALVDADTLIGTPPRLISLSVAGTPTQTIELRAVPHGAESDDRAIDGFVPIEAASDGACPSPPWGILLVRSISAGAWRVVAVNPSGPAVCELGTFQGDVRDRRGWWFLVGQGRSGHASALSCGFYGCSGFARTDVFDGGSFGRPAETSFERIEDIAERQEVVAVTAAGRRYRFDVDERYAFRPLPIDQVTFEGSTLRGWGDGAILGQVELPAPILAAYHAAGGAACLLRGAHGPAVATVDAAAELTLYRYEELTAEGCPADVSALSGTLQGTCVARGRDYIVYSDLFTQTPFSSFVHAGALDAELVATLGSGGAQSRLLLGRIGQTDSPDIVCVDNSLLTGHLGACAAVPRWIARWDGSQPGRPVRTGIQSTAAYNDGEWFLALTMPGGAVELLGETGEAVPVPVGLLDAGVITAGAELDMILTIRRAPTFQGGDVYLQFDPAVVAMGSVRLPTDARERGVAVETWAVGEGTAHLGLTVPQPLPSSVVALNLARIRLRIRPDSPPGSGAIRVVAPTQLRRSDGSAFSLQLGELPYFIRCPLYDVDSDGAITVADAVLVLRQVVGLDAPTPRQRCAADVDADQQVSIADAIAVLRVAVGVGKSRSDGPEAPDRQARSTVPRGGPDRPGESYWRLLDATVEGQTRTCTAQLQAPEPIVGFSIQTTSAPGAVASISPAATAGWLSAASSGAVARMAAVTMQPATAQVRISMSSAAPDGPDAPLVLAGMAVGQSGIRYRWGEHRLAREDGEQPPPVIARTALHPNHPNPFNPQTAIRFDLADGGLVSLRVFDAHGRCVRALVDGWMPAGAHVTTWDGIDASGAAVASGVYWCRLRVSGDDDVRSMTLVR